MDSQSRNCNGMWKWRRSSRIEVLSIYIVTRRTRYSSTSPLHIAVKGTKTAAVEGCTGLNSAQLGCSTRGHLLLTKASRVSLFSREEAIFWSMVLDRICYSSTLVIEGSAIDSNPERVLGVV